MVCLRKDQQEFIAAVADKTVIGAQIVSDDADHGTQNRVAEIVSEKVVVQLEIVYIHDCNACSGGTEVAQEFFVVAAAVCARQNIGIKFVRAVGKRFSKFLPPDEAVNKVAVGFTENLKDMNPTV